MDSESARQIVHNMRRFSFYASVITVLVSLTVMTGWSIDITLLTSISREFASTKFNTALGFLFLGASLIIFHGKHIVHKNIISISLAVIALVISVLTLSEYIFNIDLAIDEFFIYERPDAVFTYYPGRMAPNTAISFIIASIAMVLLCTGRWKLTYVSQLLAFGLIFLNLVPLLGYVFSRPELYGSTGYNSMALITVLLFINTGSGILMANPASGLISIITRTSISGLLARKFIPRAMLLQAILILVMVVIAVSDVIDVMNDIQLIAFTLILIFVIFLAWFVRSVETIHTSLSKAIDKASLANDQLRNHIDNSPLALVEWDKHLRVKKWSHQAERIFGWTFREVAGRNPFEWGFIYEEDKAMVENTMQNLFSSEKTNLVISNRNYTKQGDIVHCVWYNSVLHDRNGKVLSVFSQVDDVTSQRKTEKMLADSEEQHRSLVEISQEAILINQENRIVFINPAGMRLFGAETREQLIGKPTIHRFHSDYHDIIRSRVKKLYNGESVPVIEEKIVRLDGAVVDVEVAATAFSYRNKPATMVIARDITERKMALKDLKRNEFLLRMAGNINRIGGWMVNLSSRKVFWSDQVAAIHEMPSGFTPAISDVLSFIAPEYKGKMERLFDDCISAGNSFDVELQIVTGRGQLVWVRYTGIAERDESGEIINIIGGVQDIGRIKISEQIIKNLNNDLEKRVKERTLQLEASNKDLEMFSYSVSHDLRAPLRAINGFVRILQEEHSSRLDAEGKKICQIIMDNAGRMKDLIDDLLDFSRLYQRSVNASQINMGKLVQSVVNEVATPADRSRIEFIIGDLLPVQGDPAMIRQVWSNLVSNAVKFSSGVKFPRITISSCLNNDYTEYIVEDNGVGFDMNHADKIFGVFKRLHNARQFEGTGVGLAIVQRIVEKHGGTVRAKGEPGKGAVFSFCLPSKHPGQNEIYETETESYAPAGGSAEELISE
jgi:PAS domain S-box-containing protein